MSSIRVVSNGLTQCQVCLVTKIVQILRICSVDANVNAECPIHFQTCGVIRLLSRNRNKSSRLLVNLGVNTELRRDEHFIRCTGITILLLSLRIRDVFDVSLS